MTSKRIVFGVLNWGLGHATRSCPIIRELLNRKWNITLVSSGVALAFLKKEFPQCECLEGPDYGIRYSKKPVWLIPYLILQIPGIFLNMSRERRFLKRLSRRIDPDLIISDNRYGFYRRGIPSVFITHQLRFAFPAGFRKMAVVSSWFNRLVFRCYDAVFVPDEAGYPNLSGDLSHKGIISGHKKVNFIGALSSIEKMFENGVGPLKILVSISGPEPQRSLFEKKMREILPGIPGKKVCCLGRPDLNEKPVVTEAEELIIYPHCSRKEMSRLMNRADMVICRSGYTTVMELVACNKPALLVPTPAQTEQEYLGDYYKKTGLFSVCSQSELSAEIIRSVGDIPCGKINIQTNKMELIMNRLDELCR